MILLEGTLTLTLFFMCFCFWVKSPSRTDKRTCKTSSAAYWD